MAWLEESGQWPRNIHPTHLLLASGKPVLKKIKQYLVVTLKMQGTSFLLAWMTSDSRTPETSNSRSRMSKT